MPYRKTAPSGSAEPQEKSVHDEPEPSAAAHGMHHNGIARPTSDGAARPRDAQSSEHYAGRDRRLFPRYGLQRDAVAQFCNRNRSRSRYLSCSIHDLSFSGVQVLFSRELGAMLLEDDIDKDFEVLFSLPEKNRSVCLRCRLVRMRVRKDEVAVGATCEQSQLELQHTIRRTRVKHWCVQPGALSHKPS
ncbi:PilZ domain-containing protein [Oceanidesulfovibrio marinus]|nr:PilZ domain-containing protein [Oceanidesulfovibrio marinus]